ncbi:MAG: T9SS type A sorting domain-containing protein [Candidatus Eiseniibacteriota bacterium]|nr:MAG: T9SS type A sorting domain-containing protein [Candidatus Eisenbacteria bacterium]
MYKVRSLLFICTFGIILSAGSAAGQGVYIPNVPDANQPPTPALGTAIVNYCAPMSAVNITQYWDSVMAYSNAVSVNAGLPMKTAAKYIGYFMGTNGQGSPARMNNPSAPVAGTRAADQHMGFYEYVRWDSLNMFLTPPPTRPPAKKGYSWTFAYLDSMTVANTVGFNFCASQIDSGRPVKIDFLYWNPQPTGDIFIDSASGDTMYFFEWGPVCSSSAPPDPVEQWDFQVDGIGHAVTGVGYFRNFDPDTTNGLPQGDYIVVHDNWDTTPANVAILWDNWASAIGVYPWLQPVIIDKVYMLDPLFEDGVTSSYAGLSEPAPLGICSPAHSDSGLYFPSDTLSGYETFPFAWMVPGVHVGTRYGPGRVRLESCSVPDSIVVIPDRNSNSCQLLVRVPDEEFIDEASDLNALRVSSGEVVAIPINDVVETMVFLASCDGHAEYEGGPSPDQSLEVLLDYEIQPDDAVFFDDIHPAGRLEMTGSDVFVFGNEVFVCSPAYFNLPSPDFDLYHSEAWHWYALYPDTEDVVESITFTGMQAPGGCSDIYIFALSYRRPSSVVGVPPGKQGSGSPGAVLLSQSYPNPFNPVCTIRYEMRLAGRVCLRVFDVTGSLVRTLVDAHREAGTYSKLWDGQAEDGRELPSGVYFYRLEAGDFVATRKMVLLR